MRAAVIIKKQRRKGIMANKYKVEIEIKDIKNLDFASRLHQAITDFILNELPDELTEDNWQLNHRVTMQ